MPGAQSPHLENHLPALAFAFTHTKGPFDETLSQLPQFSLWSTGP